MDARLAKLHEMIASTTQGMTGEQLARHPEGKWSSAQVLEHLYLTYINSTKGLKRCLEAGKPLATKSTLKQRVQTVLVVECGYFPTGRKSPPRSEPKGMPAEAVLAETTAAVAAMDEALSQCEARFWKSTPLMDHPVLGPLTARRWRNFHWLHCRHHMKQITRLRQGTR